MTEFKFRPIGNDRGCTEADVPCPVCGTMSSYDRDDDRFYHRDGTDNRACWVHISSGRPIAPASELPVAC